MGIAEVEGTFIGVLIAKCGGFWSTMDMDMDIEERGMLGRIGSVEMPW